MAPTFTVRSLFRFFVAKIESQRMCSRFWGAQIELWRVAYDAPHIHSPLCALGSEDVD